MPSDNESIEEQLKRRHSHYILITCDPTSQEEKMEVRLSYDGDPYTAAFLLEEAQGVMDGFIEEKMSDEVTSSSGEKIEPLLQNIKIG